MQQRSIIRLGVPLAVAALALSACGSRSESTSSSSGAAAWSMPIAFTTAVLVSLATPRSVPVNAARAMVRLHAPEEVTARVRPPAG